MTIDDEIDARRARLASLTARLGAVRAAAAARGAADPDTDTDFDDADADTGDHDGLSDPFAVSHDPGDPALYPCDPPPRPVRPRVRVPAASTPQEAEAALARMIALCEEAAETVLDDATTLSGASLRESAGAVALLARVTGGLATTLQREAARQHRLHIVVERPVLPPALAAPAPAPIPEAPLPEGSGA